MVVARSLRAHTSLVAQLQSRDVTGNTKPWSWAS
jgi:hypothetical protein